jgi:signal transduction histidine kinase
MTPDPPRLATPTSRGIHRWLSEHAMLVDAAIVLILLPPSLLTVVAHSHHAVAITLPLTAGFLVPLFFRRRAPMLCLGCICVVGALELVAGAQLFAAAACLVALYSVAASRPWRDIALGTAALEVGAILAVIRWAADARAFSIVPLTAVIAGAVALGINTQTRRAYLATLEDRAARLERERDQEIRIAAVTERTRIAREMHDIVAHHLTVMITLSEAAAAQAVPERGESTMRIVSATGREALADLRRALGVLRRDADVGKRQPQPDLDQLAALVEQVRAAGTAVTLTVRGARQPLDAGTELSIFRTVQEALTNVMKHAGAGARAEALLSFRPGAIDVIVTDDGKAAGSRDLDPAGHGLEGMRERVAAHGGVLSAGPGLGGGWQVRAVFPLAADHEVLVS